MLICLAADANIYTEKKCVLKYEMEICKTLLNTISLTTFFKISEKNQKFNYLKALSSEIKNLLILNLTDILHT